MAEKHNLDLHHIVAFTRLVRIPVINPGESAADTMCPCNAKCSCADNTSCCENKCGCDGDTSRESDLEDGQRTISLLSDPKFGEIVKSFDAGAVKTIQDFLNLASEVQKRIKG